MDPKTTAVILIEYQNDFTSEGGSLHDAVKGVMEQEQRLAIEKNYPMFSRPMNHDDFLTALSGTEAAETTGRGYTS